MTQPKFNKCEKHGCPLHWMECDAINLKSPVINYCEPCRLEAYADKVEKRTQRRGAKVLADKAREKAQMLTGRWFEVDRGGEKWDMSERQIEKAKADGESIEILTEII